MARVSGHAEAGASGARGWLPDAAHTAWPWRIHELVGDFDLEDVWALPTPGGPGDFPRLVQLIASSDPSQDSPSRAARALWAIRWKLGEWFGWDAPDAGLGARVPTLRDRLSTDLRNAPAGPEFDALAFVSLYQLEDEYAAEIANRTVHGVMHLGWVEEDNGSYRGQMAVYEAEWAARHGIHGGDQAVQARRRLPADDVADRACLAGVPARSGPEVGRVGSSGSMNRETAIGLLDRLHEAQNEFYAGDPDAFDRLLAPPQPIAIEA